MNKSANYINKMLKTKEDRQGFVLVALILFILFVKGYMVIVSLDAGNRANIQQHAEIIKMKTKPNG